MFHLSEEQKDCLSGDKKKKLEEAILCEVVAVFCCSVILIDKFLLEFSLEYFSDNIMSFTILVGLIILYIRDLVKDWKKYRELKDDDENRGEVERGM